MLVSERPFVYNDWPIPEKRWLCKTKSHIPIYALQPITMRPDGTVYVQQTYTFHIPQHIPFSEKGVQFTYTGTCWGICQVHVRYILSPSSVKYFPHHSPIKGYWGIFATILGRKNSLTREKVFLLIAAISLIWQKLRSVKNYPIIEVYGQEICFTPAMQQKGENKSYFILYSAHFFVILQPK